MSEFVLTEDVSLYQFRNKPDRTILEILVPKTKKALSMNYPVNVIYINEVGNTVCGLFNINGRNSVAYENDCDIILKPQKRPFTHEEILELRRQWAVFRFVDYDEKRWYQLVGYAGGSVGFCDYLFSNGTGVSYKTLVEHGRFSEDDGNTWHKLEKEV